MQSRKNNIFRWMLLAILTSCTGSGAGSDPLSSEETSLRSSTDAVETARTVAEDSSVLGLTAVVAASNQTGRLTTTGTFTESGGSWTYDQTPSDRMVIRFQDGTSVEFEFETIEGIDTSSVENFLNSTHRLDFTVSSEDDGTVRVYSEKHVQDRLVNLAGSLRINERDYEVDLELVGWEYFDNDSSGMQYDNEYTATGTVTGGDYLLTVDEQWEYVIVSVDGSSSSASTKVLNSRLVAGGQDYQWDNCTLQKAFSDGQPGDPDHWQATGGLRRDGEAHGFCDLYGTAHSVGFAVYINNEATILEEWMLPTQD